MNVVGRHHIIEHRQAEALLGLEDPMQITAPITRKPQEETSFDGSGE
jgi:hypothetical protein